MNGRGSRNKGANGEREFLKLIGDRLDLPFPELSPNPAVVGLPAHSTRKKRRFLPSPINAHF